MTNYDELISFIRNYRNGEELCLNVKCSIMDKIRFVGMFLNIVLLIAALSTFFVYSFNSDFLNSVRGGTIIILTVLIISFLTVFNEIPLLYRKSIVKEYSRLHSMVNHYCYVFIVYIMYYIFAVKTLIALDVIKFNTTFIVSVFVLLSLPMMYAIMRKYLNVKTESYHYLYTSVKKYLNEKYPHANIHKKYIDVVINTYLKLIYVVYMDSCGKRYSYNEAILMCCIGHIEYHVRQHIYIINQFEVGKVLKIYKKQTECKLTQTN